MKILLQVGDEVNIAVPDDDGGDPFVVILDVGQHPDGTKCVELRGENCNLEGELPGLYYLTPA